MPTEWHGYHINTGFHIGVQITLLMEDNAVNERMRATILSQLLFGDEDGYISSMPETMEELEECITWFMSGWSHDNNSSGDNSNEKLMDYDIDQGRIYADFLHIYGIDLETAEMHWWKFNWLLWNMPHDKSSFLQVIGYRQEKPRKGATAEERKAIVKRQEIYGLKQKPKKYKREEVKAIDEFDKMMAKFKK